MAFRLASNGNLNLHLHLNPNESSRGPLSRALKVRTRQRRGVGCPPRPVFASRRALVKFFFRNGRPPRPDFTDSLARIDAFRPRPWVFPANPPRPTPAAASLRPLVLSRVEGRCFSLERSKDNVEQAILSHEDSGVRISIRVSVVIAAPAPLPRPLHLGFGINIISASVLGSGRNLAVDVAAGAVIHAAD